MIEFGRSAAVGLALAIAIPGACPSGADDSLSDPPIVLSQYDEPVPAQEMRDRAREAAEDRGNRGNSSDDDDARPPAREPGDVSGQIDDLGNSVKQNKGKETPAPAHDDKLDRDCHVDPAGGWFQPVQGVYQDDPIFPAVEWGGRPLPNPVLEEQRGPGSYRAMLPMIEGRDTILMGVERYRNKTGVVAAGSHDEIVIKGTGNCSRRVGVKIRFRYSDYDGWHDLYTTDVIGWAPLEGRPLLHPSPFRVTLTARNGIPPQDAGPFKVRGSYYIVAELLKANGEPTSLHVVVEGATERLEPPVVQFVPVMLSHVTMSKQDVIGLEAYVRDLAEASHKFIPDYYPLPPDGLSAYARPLLNVADLDPRWAEFPTLNRSELQKELVRRLSTVAALGGADRVVAVFRDDTAMGSDYDRVSTESVGTTLSTKVIAIRIGKDPASAEPGVGGLDPVILRNTAGKITSDLVDTVAHELAHSLPDFCWSGTRDRRHNMVTSCGLDFHNSHADHRAYGERIDIGGYSSERRREDQRVPILGSSTEEETWITQCTYAHLIGAMLKRPDPALLLVPVMVSRSGRTNSAQLSAFYDLTGTADLAPGTTKSWALLLRDSAHRLLATYPFEPTWAKVEGGEVDSTFVLLRAPLIVNAASAEVAFNGAVLASRSIAAQPPVLSVEAPVESRGPSVHVRWSAKAAGTEPLLASVLYSTDGGHTFNDQLFERTVSDMDVTLDPKVKMHFIKVVVSDGGRSNEKVVQVRSTN